MKQLRKRLPRNEIAGTDDNLPTAKRSLLRSDSRLSIGLHLQHRTTVPEFIIRRAGGANAVGKFLLDLCNDRVLWTATRPILLRKAGGRACYRKILVPVDFTKAARIAAEFAINRFPNAQIVFLHAFQEPEDSSHEARHAPGNVCSQRLSSQERAIAKLVHITDQLRPSDNLISRVAHFGSTFSVVANYAARMDADLILIGPQEHLCFKDLLFGSAASRIANCTNADVLVMPNQMSRQGISPTATNGTTREHRRIMPALSSYKP